jgi:hypothetical protein
MVVLWSFLVALDYHGVHTSPTPSQNSTPAGEAFVELFEVEVEGRILISKLSRVSSVSRVSRVSKVCSVSRLSGLEG